MPEYIDNVRDWDRKWTSCVVGVNINDQLNPALIQRFYESRGHVDRAYLARYGEVPENNREVLVEVEFYERPYYNNKKTLIVPVSSELISWDYPVIGAVNTEDSVLFITRRNRSTDEGKFKEGYYTGNMVFEDPCMLEKNYLGLNYISRPTGTHLKSLFNDEMFKPDEALELVTSHKRLAAAFSKNYWFQLNHTSNQFVLFRNNRIIGVVKDSTIVMIPKILEQFSHEVINHGVKVEVES